MNPDRYLSESDRRAVTEAVRRAERITSGEIVVYVVGACDEYREGYWRAATVGAIFFAGLAAIIQHRLVLWIDSPALWMVLPPTAGAAVGFVSCLISRAILRFFLAAPVVEKRVQDRARKAFLEEEVFDTRDRTGILLFAALFERRVVVLGDTAVHRAVPRESWEAIVRAATDAVRGGRLGDGLVQAVESCARLLKTHGLAVRPDDRDEISNEPRVRET